MWDGVTPIRILLGRDGLYGLKNTDRVPLGGLLQLRNATLEDTTLRTAGGAAKLGTAIPGAPKISAAVDYFPTTGQQRTVVMASDGTLQKDDGAGGGWATLLSGLTASGAVPFFTPGGGEVLNNDRLLFYADGLNQERVMVADGASFAALTSPPADWAGTNRPSAFVIHEGYNWAFGNKNAPHLLYRSLHTNHRDFTTTRFAVPIFSGEGEYLVGGLSYKGGLLLWKFPEGAYWYDTRNADTNEWRAFKVGAGGMPGPGCCVLIEDDAIWVDPYGGVHMISATTATGSVRAQDLAYRKLGRFIPDQISREELPRANLIYYSDKQQLWLACAATGATTKNRRLILDLNNKGEVGERWSFEDRDTNEALFLRKKAGVLRPAMGDDVGQLWELDQVTRSKDGAGYTFEWWLADTDFAQRVPGWAGKLKNLHYLQALHVPLSTVSHSIEVWRDGNLRQTLAVALSGGSVSFPLTLPFTFGAEMMQVTRPRRLRGQARRLAFRGLSTVAATDISLSGLIVGVTLAGGT